MDLKYEFIKVTSYHGDKQGQVKVTGLSNNNLKGQNILIVEDIVDSGRTIMKMHSWLKE